MTTETDYRYSYVKKMKMVTSLEFHS